MLDLNFNGIKKFIHLDINKNYYNELKKEYFRILKLILYLQ